MDGENIFTLRDRLFAPILWQKLFQFDMKFCKQDHFKAGKKINVEVELDFKPNWGMI